MTWRPISEAPTEPGWYVFACESRIIEDSMFERYKNGFWCRHKRRPLLTWDKLAMCYSHWALITPPDAAQGDNT